MRKTKIICTIGPASESEDIFRQMCLAGLNVARLNFSHGDHQEPLKRIEMIRRVRDELHLPIAIMLDTKGPEYRIGTFANHRVTLADGQDFTFTVDKVEGDETRVSVSYEGFARDLKPGDRILVNNGLVVCRVQEVKGNDVLTRVEIGGELSDRKSMNFPGKLLSNAFLSEQDKKDLLFGIEQDVDYVAASFVSTKADAQEMRDFLDANGGQEIDIIAKIENQSGVDHIDEICEVADGVMVARGDLGVEVPFVELPAIQKMLIHKCRLLGKRVVTATEMLESMINNPRPTRAEISDVANAVYDGTSAVMLSGESAAGKFPVEAVKSMAEICEYTEGSIDYVKRFHSTEYTIKDKSDAISHASCAMAIDVRAKCIVINSLSGKTARLVSRFRCPVDIVGITTREKVWRKLNLCWGVTPVMTEEYSNTEVLFYHAVRIAKRTLDLAPGDNIVLTAGQITGKSGNSNTIRVEIVP